MEKPLLLPKADRLANMNGQRAHDTAHALFWAGVKEVPELKRQVKEIMTAESGECEPAFLGFLGIYYHLSEIIPHDRIIYDLGCCWGFQAWFFRNHKLYVGVDMSNCKKFQLQNTEYYTNTIADFITLDLVKIPSFAICNYVPPWVDDNEKLVREAFRHVFVFYPESEKNGKKSTTPKA